MTILFQGTLNSPQGLRESPVFNVPANIKQPGISLDIKASFVAENFPNGTTTITLFISIDGGNTYRSASTTVIMPATFRGPPPHFWFLTFGLGPNDVPTHAKFSTDAPQAFSTQATLETSGGS